MITPDLKTFKDLAVKGDLIPIMKEVIADTETPVSAYRKIAYDFKGRPRPYSFMLESVEGGENIARYSFLGVDPLSIYAHSNGRGRILDGKGTSKPVAGRDVFEEIDKAIKTFRYVPIPGLPPFSGGAVGYTSYDVISEVEKTVRKPAANPVPVPEALFMITDAFLAFDRVRHTIKIIVHAHIRDGIGPEKAYAEASAKIRKIEDKLKKPLSLPTATMDDPGPDIKFSSNKTREEFCSMVRRAKKYILDGDIIQTVLSQRFSARAPLPPLSVYRALRMLNPSPYMFLLQCGDFALVGASPEVHAKCINAEITVRPIAGTRRRGRTHDEDLSLEKELLADAKERAEHIMLVDLARNDIGRVAETGSVKVDELMVVERYSHVMHIVSNVRGRLRKGLGTDAVMRATYPAGTLSGAPKVRAMQIISELEKQRRGPYGGAVAYYSFDGNFDSCITIRTAVLKGGKAYIQAGAGIVADSVPESEFEETCSKAKAMMKAISLAKNFKV